ncbi:MAG: MobH family relaxase [Methylovulum miyakonense]|uniref:MobH family relaxase n=1 Tax=Methylovulum miyakonense TaxID=645578 RepID=UPI003BB67549
MEKINLAFINRLGKRLLGGGSVPIDDQPPPPDEEIPRYPPFMKGLPAAPVDRILSTQTELINAIEHALSLPDDLYQSIAAPVIERYAAFSHLLPASESHHHRGAGGLFRHGLEVAHWATQAAQGCLFATHATPRERKEQELRWRLAVCFAGLLHDIGKPVSDMAVVDRHGEYTWNPCDENLTDWATQNGIDRYFLRWRENRHKRHEQFSALVIERVLTRASRSYILAPGPDIMQAMLETIHGLDRGAKLSELVMAADCKSVERDLKAHHHATDPAMGMPVEKYLFDAMRRLIKSGHWLANDKGARLWRFKEGLHIVWRTGAQDIVELLAKDKVPGIPRDEDTLADILIERGLAIPKILPDGRQYRYWRIQPQGLEVTLYMLRLASTELVFSNEPPVIVEGVEVSDEAEATVIATSGQDATKLVSQPDRQIDYAIADPVCATPPDQENRQVCPGQSAIGLPVDTALFSSGLDEPETSADTETPRQDKLPPEITATTKNAKKLINQSCPSQLEEKSVLPINNPQPEADPIDIARNWLQAQGLVGEWLIHISHEQNAGRLKLGTDILESQGKCLLAFPDIAQQLAIEPNLFIKALEEKGWLVTDILSPMRKVQVIHQVRGVLLAAEPSGFMKQLLTVSNLPVTPALSEQLPKLVKPTTAKCNKKTLPGKPEKSGKTQAITQPKPQPEVKPANTEKPVKQDAALEVLSKTITGQHPNPNTPSGSQAVMALIDQLRKAKASSSSSSLSAATDNSWCNVEESDIAQCLQQHPGLKRSALLREMASHPDCRLDEGGFKVRIQP